jgi:hypothetical protein
MTRRPDSEEPANQGPNVALQRLAEGARDAHRRLDDLRDSFVAMIDVLAEADASLHAGGLSSEKFPTGMVLRWHELVRDMRVAVDDIAERSRLALAQAQGSA